jgi:hypothetical protein
MLSWEDVTNIVHHHLWERRGAKYAVRVRRRLERWRDRAKTDGRPALLPQARTPKEARMPTELEQQALFKAMLPQLDPAFVELLRAELRAELLTELRPEAEALARASLEEAFTDRKERLLDQLAKEKQVIEADTNARFESEVQAALADERQDWEDKINALRTKYRQALARAQAAEAVVVSMMSELCAGIGQRETYLYSGGCGLRTLNKGVINRILATGGVVLKSKATVSERKVLVTLDDGQTAEHTVFWLAKTTPAGVIDADDAEAEDTR